MATFSAAWDNSWHFGTPPQVVYARHDVWETSAKIPYWWRVTTQIWGVLLTGWSRFPTNKKHHPDPGSRVVARHQYGISVLVSHTSFCGKPPETSRSVRCFLRLLFWSNIWVMTFWCQSFYIYLIYSKQQYQAMFTLYRISDAKSHLV